MRGAGWIIQAEDLGIAHVNPDTGDVQSLDEHLRGTAYLAGRNCPLESLKNMVQATALLHDAGKLDREFSDYMREVLQQGKTAKKRQVDHSTAGGRIVEKMAKGSLLSEMVSTAVYAHHGLQDCISMESGETLSERRGKKDIDFKAVEEDYFRIVNKEMLLEQLKAAHIDLQKICAEIKTFVSATEERSCGHKDFYLGMYERVLLSVLMDSDWTDTACFSQGEPIRERRSKEVTKEIWDRSISDFEAFMKKFQEGEDKSPLDAFRREISDICRQASREEKHLYRLTVPTGAGKTFSSLRFALHHAKQYEKDHIIYVAPYNSILEQNAEDIRRAVGNEEIVLEHHCNIVFDEEEKEQVYKKLTENWDSPIVVTTAVQLLNTLFSAQKSSIRRMYNLCNSVIIFDEVQAFPVRGTELFHLAVNFLTVFCDTTVVLCSATQPSLAKLSENNLVECEEMSGETERYAEAFRRVEIKDETELVPGGMSEGELSRFALQMFRRYGSVLVIVNTKACAKNVYEHLRQNCEEECELYHLSTSMCPENRSEELNEIKKNLKQKNPIICISTQLVEAGVNISFGCVIRSLAGLDSIIQAAGRCNRHKELKIGRVFIVKMSQEAERLKSLEDIRRARAACEKVLYLFRQNPETFDGTLDSEQAVKTYYEIYFHEVGLHPTKYLSAYPEITLEDLLSKNSMGWQQYKRSHGEQRKGPYFKQAFRTAGETYQVIPGDEKVTVVIPYDEKAKVAIELLEDRYASAAEKKKALRKLQRYSVGISEYQEKRLGRALYRAGESQVLVLSEDYYDKKEGVLEGPKGTLLQY